MTTPTEESVVFASQGLKLSGIVRLPAGMQSGERRPAFIVLHGFGSNKAAGNVLGPCRFMQELGYVTLRFDMRGCGESEGERGHLICLDQVQNTRDALTMLQGHRAVDPKRIALVGSSFGAAVAIYAAGVDERVAATVSSGGWGHGERKFRLQHPTPEAWKRFTEMLAAGREHRERTGQSLMVPRYDIVPIPPELRAHQNAAALKAFTAETAQSMFDFRANDVVGNIAPRPLLLLHSAQDSVTPTAQSIELFQHARSPVDLHLFAETDHFMLAEDNVRVHTVVRDWLKRYFPAN